MSQLFLSVVTDLSDWPMSRRAETVLVADMLGEGWSGVVSLPPPSPFRKRHGIGCSCCSREGLSMVLAQVFQDHVTGARSTIRGVVVLVGVQEQRDVLQMLEQDVLVRARYRLQD
ncbi:MULTISPECIES: hypothetical protein [unclassified Gluconobacter]|uniref:hypothetical protein n=1 Tax=unclassified Gluconobacter TaxID=2644261 RepID=UPI001C047579|nr:MULTISPECIES: hypothetical protein [unclassified Gluconobacter]